MSLHKFTTPVLIVDDEVMMITVMTRILERLGYTEVDYAADGLTALEKMRARPYGIVICDWLMEPISGYDLLRWVRADQRLQDTPFIMATTQTVMQNAVAAKQAGVDGYLLKPFTPVSLQKAIEASLPARRAHETGGSPHPAKTDGSGIASSYSRDQHGPPRRRP